MELQHKCGRAIFSTVDLQGELECDYRTATVPAHLKTDHKRWSFDHCRTRVQFEETYTPWSTSNWCLKAKTVLVTLVMSKFKRCCFFGISIYCAAVSERDESQP